MKPQGNIAIAVVAILALTLLPSGSGPPLPFSFGIGGERRWLADAILNVCLFVPLGIAVGWKSRSLLGAIVFGLLLSTGIEIAQTAIPGRDPSLSDIISNTLGAGAGALFGGRPGTWLFPDFKGRVILVTVTLVTAASVMWATGALLSPAGSAFSLARSGHDLVLRYPTRGGVLGLDEPEYWAKGIYFEPDAGRTRIDMRREGSRWVVGVGGSGGTTLGPTVGEGWALLAYPDALGRRWGFLVSAVWIFALCLPIGFYSRGLLRLVALLGIASLLLLIPWVLRIVPTTRAEWIGGTTGLLSGMVLAWLRIAYLRSELQTRQSL